MQIRLNEVLEGSSDATIVLWHSTENDRVAEGEDLVEITTDKATFDVPVPCNGVLRKIIKKQGERVRTDEVIAEISEDTTYGAKRT